MNMSLQNKCALITGSFAGLGHAIAERLAREGANVVLTGLESEEDARRIVERMNENRVGTVVYHQADLAQVSQIENLTSTVLERFGGIDIVVNNAVVRHFLPVVELPTEQWEESLAVNLSAAFHTARLTIPRMRERGWGRILNISSVYGFGAAVNRVGYVTTKTALIGMTRAIALETAGAGITCNAICPGTVPTPAITSRIADIARQRGISEEQAAREYLAERQPTGRFVAMENVAAMAIFLCGEAGRDVTGAILPMDGGWTARG